MILADKIINLRKKNGWSQEELADKMQVSRQAVSKWEGAQSIPDLEKVLMLSRLFGVTTDYLLKDDIEDEEFANESEGTPLKRVSFSLANEYLIWRKKASQRIAFAVFLCIVAIIPLLIMVAFSQRSDHPISEKTSVGAGLVSLLVLVAIAVAIFVACGFKNASYDFIGKEPFDTEYGVDGMVKEKQKAYRPIYVRGNIIAVCLCILSPIPLFVSLYTDQSYLIVLMVAVTLLIAGIGVTLFILVGVRWESLNKLLKAGTSFTRNQRKDRIKKNVATIYWLIMAVIYLAWSFLSRDWKITWIVWPIGGVLFGVVELLCNLLIADDETMIN